MDVADAWDWLDLCAESAGAHTGCHRHVHGRDARQRGHAAFGLRAYLVPHGTGRCRQLDCDVDFAA